MVFSFKDRSFDRGYLIFTIYPTEHNSQSPLVGAYLSYYDFVKRTDQFIETEKNLKLLFQQIFDVKDSKIRGNYKIYAIGDNVPLKTKSFLTINFKLIQNNKVSIHVNYSKNEEQNEKFINCYRDTLKKIIFNKKKDIHKDIINLLKTYFNSIF